MAAHPIAMWELPSLTIKKKKKKLANIQVVQQTPAQYVRQSLAIYLFLDTNLGP